MRLHLFPEEGRLAMSHSIFVLANDDIPIGKCLYDDSIELAIDPSVALIRTFVANLCHSFAVYLVTNHLTIVLTAQSQLTPVTESELCPAYIELRSLALSFLKDSKPFRKNFGVVAGT